MLGFVLVGMPAPALTTAAARCVVAPPLRSPVPPPAYSRHVPRAPQTWAWDERRRRSHIKESAERRGSDGPARLRAASSGRPRIQNHRPAACLRPSNPSRFGPARRPWPAVDQWGPRGARQERGGQKGDASNRPRGAWAARVGARASTRAAPSADFFGRSTGRARVISNSWQGSKANAPNHPAGARPTD